MRSGLILHYICLNTMATLFGQNNINININVNKRRIPIWKERDELCTNESDCYGNGKMCDGIMDVTCICKNKRCKISSGCGTLGAFSFIPCNTCNDNEEDCEDEGACIFEAGNCIPIDKDESCTDESDCHKNGKMCDGIMNVACICKNKRCKISSGCGTLGAFGFIHCNACNGNAEGCEDEEGCIFEAGNCIPKGKDGSCIDRQGNRWENESTWPAEDGCNKCWCRNGEHTCTNLAVPCAVTPTADESCTDESDCQKNGKMCDGIMDVECICKNKRCKISSGCGINGACNTCNGNTDGCEDEGACIFEAGNCIPIDGSCTDRQGNRQENGSTWSSDDGCDKCWCRNGEHTCTNLSVPCAVTPIAGAVNECKMEKDCNNQNFKCFLLSSQNGCQDVCPGCYCSQENKCKSVPLCGRYLLRSLKRMGWPCVGCKNYDGQDVNKEECEIGKMCVWKDGACAEKNGYK